MSIEPENFCEELRKRTMKGVIRHDWSFDSCTIMKSELKECTFNSRLSFSCSYINSSTVTRVCANSAAFFCCCINNCYIRGLDIISRGLPGSSVHTNWFRYSEVFDTTFTECTLPALKFQQTSLTGVRFVKCKLPDNFFFLSKLTNVTFEDCDFGPGGLRKDPGTIFEGVRIIRGGNLVCTFRTAFTEDELASLDSLATLC